MDESGDDDDEEDDDENNGSTAQFASEPGFSGSGS